MTDLRDFPPGPLDYYRKKSSFDWKKLKVFLHGEEVLQFENELYEEIERQPCFKPNLLSPSFDEERHKTIQQVFAIKASESMKLEYLVQDLRRPAVHIRALINSSPSAYIKHGVGNSLFTSVLRSMGTDRHSEIVEQAEEGTIFGCYCLTEIGHGTNTKGMRTTATYCKEKKSFILNCEDFEAAKCWAGGLGQAATHAVVFAQLVIDNKNYGLHTFLVPIRDTKTLLPYPGIIVGDMGEKAGLNGIDNGFLMFQNYIVPREALLNKLADVTEDGQYVTGFKDPKKRHGASLGSLSAGRVNITAMCETYGTKALTIAIRYAGVRKQFGPDDKEVPILEYQTHQHRLLPYLAAAYVLRIFGSWFIEVMFQFNLDILFNTKKENSAEMGIELHAVSSGTKPLAGWIMRDAIQQCREACGGHGYLKSAGISDLRNEHDANLTYEGENHVLVQQTSNWLLKFWPLIAKRQQITSPLESINFFSNGLDILFGTKFSATTTEEVRSPQRILAAYQWLVVYLLKRTYEKLENTLNSGKPEFWAKNDNQVFFGKTLTVAFIEHFFLQRMLIKINEATDAAIKNVLLRLFSLYGLWSLEKHMGILYQGGYCVGPKPGDLVQDAILELCYELKDDAVSLVDVIAPPDFLMNSVLGASDGQVYKRLQSAIFRSPYSMSRPKWWLDIINWKDNLFRAKL